MTHKAFTYYAMLIIKEEMCVFKKQKHLFYFYL